MIITPYYGSDLVKPGYLMASNVDEGGLSVKLTALTYRRYVKLEQDLQQRRRRPGTKPPVLCPYV